MAANPGTGRAKIMSVAVIRLCWFVKEWTAEQVLSLCNSAKRKWCLPLASDRVKKSRKVLCNGMGCSWFARSEWLDRSLALKWPPFVLCVPVPFLGDFGLSFFRSNTTGKASSLEPWKSPQSAFAPLSLLFDMLKWMGRVIHAAPSFHFLPISPR